MRLIKMFGLAAIAAVAAMAFIGATTASADTLCKTKEENCAAGNRIAAGTVIEALASATLLGTLNTTCHSVVTGTVGTNEGEHKGILGLITEVTFTKCSGACPSVANNKGENLPWLMLGVADKAPSTGNGTVFVTEDGKGNPAGLLNNCLFVGNCLYENPKAEMRFDGSTTAPLFLASITLTRSTTNDSQTCPSTAGWDATYKVLKPTSMFLVPLP